MRRPLPGLLAILLLALPVAAKGPAKIDPGPVDARMQGIVARYGLEGASLWVSHNGQAVFTGHYGGYDARTRVPVASASKWLSALVLARLVERGTLRWDSTVAEWFPEAPFDKGSITLAQLFSHTSGLPGDESGCIANPQTSLQACASVILAGPLDAAPGAAFAYGGLSMQVAGAMAERASGLSWNILFDQELVQPLALAQTDYGFTSTDPGKITVPNPRIAGGVRSTLEDYRRLMAMWQADGRVSDGPRAGQRYLQPATLRAMARDYSAGALRVGVPPSVAGTEFGYGLGFWILPTERPGLPSLVTSPGAFGFQGWVDGTAGIAGVFMVRDSNVRMAPEVRVLQQDLAARLDFQRSTQSQKAVSSSLDAVHAPSPRGQVPVPGQASAQQRLQRQPDVVAQPRLGLRHRVDVVGLEAVPVGGDGFEQEGQ